MSSTAITAMQSRRLDAGAVKSKRVFLRCDFNVPLDGDGNITDTARIDRSIDGIKYLADAGAQIVLASHLGRPKGEVNPAMSLRPVRDELEKKLGRKIIFADDCIGDAAQNATADMKDGDICLPENLRFHKGEEAGEDAFASALINASGADFYVNDAFACCHRAHASITGIPKLLGRDKCYAGALLLEEVEYLSRALENSVRPVVAVVGGAKVSTKLAVLENLVGKVDYMIIGGAMANTFLKALGINVGKSLVEDDMLETANKIMQTARGKDCKIILPTDARIAKGFDDAKNAKFAAIESISDDDMIFDVGEHALRDAIAAVDNGKTLIWNGPLGAFETPPFDWATKELARYVAAKTQSGNLISVAGGGDTAAVLHQSGVADQFSYISTAGGAFLEWIEGKTLPGIAALTE